MIGVMHHGSLAASAAAAAESETVMVPMRDGVRMATEVYRSAGRGEAVEGRFPTILERTPYDRNRLDLCRSARFFAARGYNVVLQDCRGRHGSEGEFSFFRNPEDVDGFDTLAWIGSQPWSDGRIGTTGLSFAGANQQAAAIRRPPQLRTQIILDAGLDYWQRTIRSGGAFCQGDMFPYALWMALGGKEAEADPDVRAVIQAGLDDIGTWVGRLPLGRGSSPLAAAPSYENWYLEIATQADYDEDWACPLWNLAEHIDRYPDIPICLVTSWYGHHAWANFEKSRILRAANTSPVRLVAGVWLHEYEYTAHPWAGEVHFGDHAAFDLDEFRLRWFDRWLKQLDPDEESEPPITYFVMGGGDGRRDLDGRMRHGGAWRHAPEWPVPGTRWESYHLHGDGALRSAAQSEAGSASAYDFDPGSPVPTIGGSFEDPAFEAARAVLRGGAYDQRGRRELVACGGDTRPLAARPDVLVFRTGPLVEPVEITGTVRVQLWVSTTAPDTDFTAKLIDEHPASGDYPHGFAMNLTDGITRMRYRNGRLTGELLEPGAIYEIQLELSPISNLFLSGHRIRVDISSSSFPQFDVNPNTGGPLGRPSGTVVARNVVHHDRERPSRIVVPVVEDTGEAVGQSEV